MFDTMTLTKFTGGLCGALLVFLLAGWVSQGIFAMDSGHGGDDHGQAYVIDTGADETESAEAEETVDFATLYAAADIDKGEKVFSKCSACHKLEAGQNAVGPYLYGVVGRAVDTAQGFGYSGALEEVVEEWTPENLYAFLESPRSYAPGTSMAFNGLNKSEDRVNVIAYLDSLDGDMIQLTPAAATEEEAAAEPAAVEEEATEESATEEAATEEAATEEAATEEAATEEAPTEEAATEEVATDSGASDATGFAALVAAADVDAGAKVFNKCKACHVLEAGKNRVGPYLYGVVGRDIASAEGFSYSDALQGLDGEWTYDELNAFLENPRGYAQGNRMSFAGLKSEEERANVIAYIESQSN